MKKLISICLLISFLLTLVACSSSADTTKVGEKLESFSGEGDLPLRIEQTSAGVFLHRGVFGVAGGQIGFGKTLDAVKDVFPIPDSATLRSFTASGSMLAFVLREEADEKHTQTILYLFDALTETTEELGQVGIVEHAVFLDGIVYYIASDGSLCAYDPATKQSKAPLALSGIRTLSCTGDTLVIGMSSQEGHSVTLFTPGTEPITQSLPSAVSLLHEIAYDPAEGIFAIYYTDTRTEAKTLGTWFLTSDKIHEILSTSDYFYISGQIKMRNGKIFWITESKINGVAYTHYRTVVWDTQTGQVNEYMKAFSFALYEDRLLYLALDNIRKTDGVTLYTATPYLE